ncbi:cytoplasmic RNA-binding protein [Coelomomyces lativittatus]|nr:cytoplasmic RNA-binding protein [Coelomomyces lativittatus]KAJ1513843.1 cytoplasmic RNA-binding protein [Coelomomyces lativittatus]
MCDKYTGHPKGFAYIEFADPTCVANAAALNDTMLNNRPIKVTPKRTNVPGLSRHSHRARGGRGRGGYFPPTYAVPGASPYGAFPYSGYTPSRGFMPMRGRGVYRGGLRGRGGGYPAYTPY